MQKRILFRCGCGMHNYNLEDWLSHYKSGRGFWRSMKLLLLTRIELG